MSDIRPGIRDISPLLGQEPLVVVTVQQRIPDLSSGLRRSVRSVDFEAGLQCLTQERMWRNMAYEYRIESYVTCPLD
jgi:hypothetical protein